MRILLVHSPYLSGSASGENRVVEDEAALLRSAGHDVWRYSPEPRVEGVGDRIRSGTSAIWSARASRTIRDSVEQHRIEVVHVHNVFPTLSPAVLRAAHTAMAATVMTLHNFRQMCLPANLLRDGHVCEDCVGHLPWRGVIHRCYRGSVAGSAVLTTALAIHRGLGTFDDVSRYLAVSGFVRDKHLEIGLNPERVAVKPNFAWPVTARSGPGEYFLFVGRLAREKGVDTLLDAWARGEPPGRLLVVGDGPERDKLRAAAPPGVEFRGQVPSDEVPSILRDARALMVPSRWYEAAPRSITEAYAAGVPVIASRIGALPEAIDEGQNGLLAEPDDPRSWAETAARLADDGESKRLGQGALRAWQERFTPYRGLELLLAEYEAAIHTREADA